MSKRPTELRTAFAQALKALRRSKGLAQEDFSLVSSRTYVSTLERGLKSPTLDKIDELAEVLEVHPLTLLLLTYARLESLAHVDELATRASEEASQLLASPMQSGPHTDSA